MNDQATLFAKLAQTMSAVHAVPKNGRNEFHKYDYATEADVAAAIRKELADRNVCVLVSTRIRDVRGTTRNNGNTTHLTDVEGEITFACGDTGTTHSITITGTGEDALDKGVYKAITGAVKYGLMKTFLIPTGDDPERNSGTVSGETHSAAASPPAHTQQPSTGDAAAFVFKFGKHSGKPITDVPDDYLQWLLQQPAKPGYESQHSEQHAVFRAELNRRGVAA